jgi:hypothetical protein
MIGVWNNLAISSGRLNRDSPSVWGSGAPITRTRGSGHRSRAATQAIASATMVSIFREAFSLAIGQARGG